MEDMVDPFFQQGSFPKRGCPNCVPMRPPMAQGLRARQNRNQRLAGAFERDRCKTKERHMPAKSAAQQKAAGAALAAKRGERKASSLKGASRSMYESMSENELDEMASTRRKGKPEHVSGSTEKV
jgi:hypothetical protein